ncbi:M28 family peptidase [Verrucomicrobiales bacterium]|nr:M28 family peptidase [Verrucomicrobiales bacterium]
MKQTTAIRLFLVGLPIGLVLTTAVSMVWHFNKPKEDGAPKVYTTLADEISAQAVSSYVSNLSKVIGERHSSKPGTLDRTANYLESTLGTRNLGYDVKRQVYDVGGQPARNLWVEIPGGKRLNEVVVVVAHYDAPLGSRGENNNASGVAALLAMAENFAREKPILSMRLAFLTHSTAPHLNTNDSGSARYAQLLERRGEQIRTVFCLDGIGAFPATGLTTTALTEPFLPNKGPFLSLLANRSSASVLALSFDCLAPLLRFTCHQAVVPDNSQSFLDESTAGAFQSAGFPTLLIRGSGRLGKDELAVDTTTLAETTRAISTLIRVLANP